MAPTRPVALELARLEPPGGHARALTGIRGVAALWVFAYHLWQVTGAGQLRVGGLDLAAFAATGHLGVDLFFVLSGFLLGMPFVRARMGHAVAPSIGRFWRHRIRRVLPAYWFQLSVLLMVAAIASGESPIGWGEGLLHLALAFNVIANESLLNPVWWSLPVEWNFYLILPLLALGLARGSGRPWLVPAAILFALGFRLACWASVFVLGDTDASFARWIIQLPARVDQFAIGIGAAWLAVRRGGRPGAAFGIAGLAAILVGAPVLASLGNYIVAGNLPAILVVNPLVALAFAALVLAASAGDGTVARGLANRWLVRAGTISYSLYLWHLPVTLVVRDAVGVEGSAQILLTVAASISIALSVSWASWRFVERPFVAGQAKVARA
jgi:peptidoglycan/LPS O-acetylase OafA/YrhL